MSGCPTKVGGPRTEQGLKAQALIASRRGRFKEAERLWLKVLQKYRTAGNSRGVMQARVHLARMSGRVGRTAVARAMLMEAFKSAKAVRDRLVMGLAKLELGYLHFRSGRFQDANEEFFWVPLYARVAKDRAMEATGVALQARIRAIRGEHEKALELLTKAIYHVSRLTGRSTRRARAHLELGRACFKLADLNRAYKHLKLARGLFLSAGGLEGLLESSRALALMEVQKGRAGEAASLLNSTASTLLSEKAYVLAAPAEHTAFRIYASIGRWKKARAALRRARRIYRLSRWRAGEARLRLDEGTMQMTRKRFRKARGPLASAAASLEGLGDRFNAGRARILLGRANLLSGQVAKATEALTRGIDHAAAATAPELSWRAYLLLGRLFENVLDREDKAERFYNGAASALEAAGAGLDVVGGERTSVRDNVYFRLARIHVKAFKKSGEPHHLDGLSTAVEKRATRRLLDILARSGATLADSEEKRFTAVALAGEERAVSEMLNDPSVRLPARKLLRSRLLTLRVLRTKAESGAIRFSAVKMEPVKLSILRRNLEPDDAFLLYQLGENAGQLLVARTNRVKVYKMPGRAELARHCSVYHRLLRQHPRKRGRTATGRMNRTEEKLRSLLVYPASSLLRGVERIYAVLPEPLGRCSLDAVFRGKLNLSKRLTVVQVPSPAIWLKLKASPPEANPTRDALVLAPEGRLKASTVRDALEAVGQKGGFLPVARIDADMLRKGLKSQKVTVWHGSRASERRFKKADLTKYRRIHLATKLLIPGVPKGPAQPAVLLWASAKDRDDGFLLLREVLGLKLGGGSVVLSGGIASALEDSGVMEAFLRTFLLAGARNVAISLWPRPESTRELWVYWFYKAMSGDVPIDQAAAYASSKLRSRKSTKDPYHWAGWVLYGTP